MTVCLTDRCPCLVPGCKRTTKAEPGLREWICPRHWQPLPKAMRRAYSRARRRTMTGKKDVATTHRIWRSLRRRAIHAALFDFI